MKQPKKKQIIAAYDKADENGKELLKSLYPDVEFEQKPITERIKTFEDARAILGEDNLFVQQYRFNYSAEGGWNDEVGRDFAAYLKLRIIIAALNEGWDVREQTDGYYWHVVFRGGNYAYAYNGLAYAGVNYDASSAYSSVGSRLVFKSKELADYCAKQFADLWKDYFIG